MHFQSDFRWLCCTPWFLIYRLSTLFERNQRRNDQTRQWQSPSCFKGVTPPGQRFVLCAHFAVEWGIIIMPCTVMCLTRPKKICKRAAQKSFSIFFLACVTLARNLTYKIQLLCGIFEFVVWGRLGWRKWKKVAVHTVCVSLCVCLMSTSGHRPGSSSISLYVNLNMCRYAHKIWTQPLARFFFSAFPAVFYFTFCCC